MFCHIWQFYNGRHKKTNANPSATKNPNSYRNPGKAAGPDNTKAKDKSMTGDSLAEGDYGLFRGVIYKKQLPHNWNYAKLKVAHKTGDSQKRENYRPLSMLSIVSKIFEV